MSEADKKTFLELVGSLNFTATASDIEDIAKSIEDIKKAEATAREKNAYDLLYVGMDGSETVNGGKLTMFLSAMAGTNSAMPDVGIWYDKVGGHNATFVGSKSVIWDMRGANGVGYDMLGGKWKGTTTKNSFLPLKAAVASFSICRVSALASSAVSCMV